MKNQILAIWSILMLLLPAGAIYLIDNYETGVIRDAILEGGLSTHSQGFANSLPTGQNVSAQEKADLEDLYGDPLLTTEPYWDTGWYGQHPVSYEFHGLDSTETIDNTNIVIPNYTGFGIIADMATWTSLTAHELATYDAIAINSSYIGVISNTSIPLQSIYIGIADGTGGYWLDGVENYAMMFNNSTAIFFIGHNVKSDLLAMPADSRVWLSMQILIAQQPLIYDWSIELLTFESEFGIDPMVAWGVSLLLIVVVSVFVLLFSTDAVNFNPKKGGWWK